MSDITSQPPAQPPPASDPDAPASPRPFPLHPNFWWAILWCVFLMLCTQVPGAVVGITVMLAIGLRDPSAIQDLNSPGIAIGLVVAVVVAHGLMILLSVGLLRILAGRDWMRKVALRLPSFTHVLLAVAILPAFMILGSAAHEGLTYLYPNGWSYPGFDRPASVGAFWAGVVFALVVIGLGQVTCRIVGGRDWYRDWIAHRPHAFQSLLSAGLLAAFVALVTLGYNAAYPLAEEAMPQKSDFTGMEDMVKAFTSMPLLGAIVVIGVFPGFSEELWCRAFLGRGLVGKYGLFWGILLTSFLFGAIHGDPRQGTMALLMGAMLHFAYQTSRSLLIPILMHFLNNSLSITLARFPAVAKVEKASVQDVWLILVAAGLLLVACLIGFWQTRTRFVGLWQPPHPGVECPPKESGSRLVAPRPPLLTTMAVLAALGGLATAAWIVVAQMTLPSLAP